MTTASGDMAEMRSMGGDQTKQYQSVSIIRDIPSKDRNAQFRIDEKQRTVMHRCTSTGKIKIGDGSDGGLEMQ